MLSYKTILRVRTEPGNLPVTHDYVYLVITVGHAAFIRILLSVNVKYMTLSQKILCGSTPIRDTTYVISLMKHTMFTIMQFLSLESTFIRCRMELSWPVYRNWF